MHLTIHHRGTPSRDTRDGRATTTPKQRSQMADYIADICLVALLAAPFMLFDAPSTLPDAVIASRAGPAAVAEPAPAAANAQPLAIDP